MEGVNSLVDTPEEKEAAAKLFLLASRTLGGNSTVRRSSPEAVALVDETWPRSQCKQRSAQRRYS